MHKAQGNIVMDVVKWKVLTRERDMTGDLLRRRNRRVIIRHVCARGCALGGPMCIGEDLRVVVLLIVEMKALAKCSIELTRSGRGVSWVCCG